MKTNNQPTPVPVFVSRRPFASSRILRSLLVRWLVICAMVQSAPAMAQTYQWSTWLGQAGSTGTANGIGNAARFTFPTDAAVDSSGNIYIVENQTVRKATPSGVVTTLAGSAGVTGSANGTGSAARFYNPSGVAVHTDGTIYVADYWNHTIRKVTQAGVVTTLAGSPGVTGSTNGTGSAARFYYPHDVAVDSAGNVYVADNYNDTIRKITPAGVVTTLAGSAGNPGAVNGTGSAARFDAPAGVAVDSSGNVFVADRSNHAIRRVTPAGVVTTFAGTMTSFGSADGTGSAARFYYPLGLAIDAGGNLFVADTYNDNIRKITPAAVVTTIGGSAGSLGSADGAGSAARFINQALITFENIYSPVGSQYSDWGVTTDGNDAIYTQNEFFTNLPSPTQFASTASAGAGTFTFNVAGGFTGMSLFYSYGDNPAATVKVYSGLNATGSLLATMNLSRNAITAYDVWTRVMASHGNALSFQIAGPMDSIYIDAVRRMGAFKPRMAYPYPYLTALGTTSMTMHADVNPAGSATSVYFQYATNAAFSGAVSTPAQNIGSGTKDVVVTQSVTGLSRGTLYYIRAVATNGAGTTTGNSDTWTTLQTTATTGMAASITASSATLHGTVVPHGLETTSYFEYATNPALTGATSTSGQSAGSGSSTVGVSAGVFSLPPGVYYYRIVATNSGGTFYGGISSFAVNPGYSVTSGAAGSFIDISGTGAQVLGPNTDDAVSSVISLGFLFDFFGTSRSTLQVSSNGLITFGAGITGANNVDFSVNTLSPNVDAIAVLWDDWVTTGTGGVYVQTTGAPGQRVFTIQWQQMKGFGSAGTNPATFQIQMFEATSDFLIIAQDTATEVTGAYSGASNGGSASIRIRKGGAPSNGSFLMYSYNSATITSGTKIRFSALKPVLSNVGSVVSMLNPGNVTLGADINPNNSPTTAQFEYGLTTSYGSTAAVSLTPPNGGTAQSVSATLTGLMLGSTYHYRLTAANAVGTSRTEDMTFTTPPPTPEIALSGNGVDIGNGDATPNAADHTDFGGTAVNDGAVVRTFTISNSGTAALNLTGAPKVAVSGANAADFTVTLDPGTPVAAGGGSTTFQVTFDPSAPGPRTATLSIANDDADENPFTFDIAGTGLTSQESWRQFYFGTTIDSGNASDTFDFDFDGLMNLMEWACGLNPTTASTLPTVLMRNGGDLEFTYTRSVEAVNAGAVFIVEWSDTLVTGSWDTAGVVQNIFSNNGTLQQVKATLPVGSSGRRFVRLRVLAPPGG